MLITIMTKSPELTYINHVPWDCLSINPYNLQKYVETEDWEFDQMDKR